jgi:glutamyl-tRNA reductase
LNCEDIERVRNARRFRPLLLIDIAVPRDIDPAVGMIEECERIMDQNLAKLHLPGV